MIIWVCSQQTLNKQKKERNVMKKKIVTLMLGFCFIISVFASACGSNKVESQKSVSDATTNTPVQQESTTNTETKSTESETPTNDSKVGTVEKGDGFEKTPVITDKALNLTGSAGPMEYTIGAVQVSKLITTTEDAATLFGIEKNKEVTVVALDVTVENTSEDDVSFFMGQATLISNTKEQVDPHMFLSDYIQGEYLGNVQSSGTLIYILPNSNATDITSLTLRVSAPMTPDFTSLSDDVEINISFE